jgi:hypothetical protein
MKKKNLIGRKVKGFRFSTGDYPMVCWSENMELNIDKEGTIENYSEHNNSYYVKFKERGWYYPADQIEAHLVDEWVIGEEYEFSDDERDWQKRKLLAVLPNNYDHRFIVELLYVEDYWQAYNHIRPIESNREVKEQIAKLEEELNKLKAKL